MGKLVTHIDSQIFSLQRAMNSLNAELQYKQSDLSRLKSVLSDLLMIGESFQKEERMCLEPPISKATWNGSLARDFDEFRRFDMLRSYRTLEKKDLRYLTQRLEEEIEKINQQILSAENHLSSHQTRLNRLYVYRREVLES